MHKKRAQLTRSENIVWALLVRGLIEILYTGRACTSTHYRGRGLAGRIVLVKSIEVVGELASAYPTRFATALSTWVFRRLFLRKKCVLTRAIASFPDRSGSAHARIMPTSLTSGTSIVQNC